MKTLFWFLLISTAVLVDLLGPWWLRLLGTFLALVLVVLDGWWTEKSRRF